MKVLMIHPHDIYHDLEPWTVRITYLAKELVQAGVEVALVYHLLDPHTDITAARKRQEFPFETIPFRRIGPGLGWRCYEIQKLAAAADVIHFQKCTHYGSIPAVFSSFWHRKPVHYDWDDWEQAIYEQNEFNRLGSWIFFQQLERHLPKLVDTISISSSGLRRLTDRFRFPADQVFYVPVGADLETFHPGVDGRPIRRAHEWKKQLVLYHGQISGANYVHLFLRAAHILATRRNDVSFAVVGGGDRLQEAKREAENLGLETAVTFTDKVPHAKVPEYIAAADVTVACFEDNAQARCKSPLKLVEYMASGKAIVASDMGEVPGMLADCGKLAAPGSPAAIAEQIEALLDRPEERRRLGQMARRRAERIFNWKNSSQVLLEAYDVAGYIRRGKTFRS